MTKVTNETVVTSTKVRIFTNEYDVDMLEIAGEKRPTFISLKKALAILATNDDADLISEVQKHGRTMYKVSYPDGKGFVVGQTKIDTVLNSESEILLGLHASIDSTKEA